MGKWVWTYFATPSGSEWSRWGMWGPKNLILFFFFFKLGALQCIITSENTEALLNIHHY